MHCDDRAAPTIETPRLTLRGHRVDDFQECAAMWADPIVTRYIGRTPSTQQQSWARLVGYVGHWQLMRFGYWAVAEKATGAFIGELGFADFKRDVVPSIDGIPELGWALVSGVHGRAYATEALRAVVAWGDEHLESARTTCIIDPENAASIRIAQNLSFRQVEQAVYNERPVIVYVRQRRASGA